MPSGLAWVSVPAERRLAFTRFVVGYGRGGTTFGHTYVTGHDHDKQWDRNDTSMIWKYFGEGLEPCTNSYEIDADLMKGDYSCPTP